MAVVGRRSDHAPFFASLPSNELLPLETGLRQVLLDWLHTKAGPFPLIEWIDLRIGGEIETRRDAQGFYEIFLRGTAPPMPQMPTVLPAQRGTTLNPPNTVVCAREDFFKRLPQDRFSPEEVKFRDAVFEFLASWKSNEFATVQSLHNFPAVQRNRSAFLPREVKLQEWIERRIGGEVELRPGKKGFEQIVCLTIEGKRLVREKFEQMAKGKTVTAPEPTAKDSFFSALPADELLLEEITLRQAVIEFMSKRLKQKGEFPTISELMLDPVVKKACEGLLPPNVKVRAWIERRIGGEIEVNKSSLATDPQIIFRNATATGPVKAAADSSTRPLAPEKGMSKKTTPARQFFESLPDDELTEAEQNLRSALIDVLASRDSPPLLVDVCRMFQKEQHLSRTRTALLPAEVSVQMWINRRIGGEVEIAKDSQGRQVVRLRQEEVTAEANLETEAEAPVEDDLDMELFFSSLPADEFSSDECQLREALLAFLGAWHRPMLPTVQHAKGDKGVARVLLSVLPRGCPVDLGAWIQRRIGGEIEVTGPGGRDAHLQKLRLVEETPPQQAAAAGVGKKRKLN
eukprot:TRINITY_DN73771_c0_g1_i1.p1 TRINITY_DN73771_c0_g1~~TRINITY_DN73771_c0_g1_i1.p1  ORF type:complete len:598 (-),score=122.67 TRINITY_DN73771_c0_g1_i1:676-2391(-)